jgi:hypothetical protein
MLPARALAGVVGMPRLRQGFAQQTSLTFLELINSMTLCVGFNSYSRIGRNSCRARYNGGNKTTSGSVRLTACYGGNSTISPDIPASRPQGTGMHRATKIVATIGPASSDIHTLKRMITAGVDAVRQNFSHGTAQDHIGRASLVREAALACGREVAIMANLQDPKNRVGKLRMAGSRCMAEPVSHSTPAARWGMKRRWIWIIRNCRGT